MARLDKKFTCRRLLGYVRSAELLIKEVHREALEKYERSAPRDMFWYHRVKDTEKILAELAKLRKVLELWGDEVL